MGWYKKRSDDQKPIKDGESEDMDEKGSQYAGSTADREAMKQVDIKRYPNEETEESEGNSGAGSSTLKVKVNSIMLDIITGLHLTRTARKSVKSVKKVSTLFFRLIRGGRR